MNNFTHCLTCNIFPCVCGRIGNSSGSQTIYVAPDPIFIAIRLVMDSGELLLTSKLEIIKKLLKD